MSYSTDILKNIPKTNYILSVLKLYPSIKYEFKGTDLILSGKKEEVTGVRRSLNKCIRI